jgi:hypothetical protein
MKGEIFNFILHSDIGVGTSVANEYYFVDWNRLPESRYKLTFAFTSSTLTIATTFDAILYISELGCTNNITCMSPSGSMAYNAGFIGILRNYTATTYLETNTMDNPPSFLRSRPRDNQINVRIHQNLSTTGTDYTPLPARYTLILSFEQLDEDDGNKS